MVGEDYAGIGVHEAARVAALARGNEILVTCSTIEDDPIPFPIVDEHAETLKGIANPVRVATVEWRPTAS